MRRRSVKPAPEWFAKLVRFVLLAIFPAMLICGREVPRSLVGLPATVVGVVYARPGGTPIEGARVFVPGDPVRFETRTDQFGMFRLELPSLGSGEEPDSAWFDGYRIAASADGMVPSDQVFHFSCPQPDPLPVYAHWVYLEPAGRRVLRSRLLESDGAPAEGIRVEHWNIATFTDENGAFELPVGHRGIFVDLTCHAGRSFRGFIGASLDEPELIGRLPRRTWIRGRVQDAVTGDGLPGAVLSPLNVLTDEQGRFEVFAPIPTDRGGGWLSANRAGYETGFPEKIKEDGSTIIRMRPLATVRLRVTAPDGTPVPAAQVDFLGNGRPCWSELDGRVVARVKGRPWLVGTIRHFRGSQRIVPGARGIRALVRNILEDIGVLDPADLTDFPVEPGDDLDLGTFTLGPFRLLPPFPAVVFTPALTIQVTDSDGNPVPWPFTMDGFKIQEIGDEYGAIVPMGKVILAKGFECIELSRELVRDGTVCLDRSVPVRGRLLRGGTEPVPDFVLSAGGGSRRMSRVLYPPAHTDSLGRFVIHGILPGGRVQVLGLDFPADEWSVLGQVKGGDQDVVITLPDR